VEDQTGIVDSFPVPVCRFGRAIRCHTFGEAVAYGYDEVAHHTHYGLRAHVRLAWPGVIVHWPLPISLTLKARKNCCKAFTGLPWQTAIIGSQNGLND
jgi:hypothetical protein